jgi:hypothetical protein
MMIDVISKQPDMFIGNAKQPEQYLYQGRLPGSVGSQKPEYTASRNFKPDIIQYLFLPVAERQIFLC